MKTKVKLEYVWLDGYTPEPNLRSKVKVIDIDENHRIGLDDCPMWSFDGSSTKQAEGHFLGLFIETCKGLSKLPQQRVSQLLFCNV